MKTRSSSGVGQKIELAFDVETLRITDPESDNNNAITQQSGNDIMKQIKAVSSISDSVEPVEKTVIGQVQGSKLKSLLNQLDP